MLLDYRSLRSKCNRGFSVVEVLVASALLVTASVVILPSLINNARTLRNISRGGDCQAYIAKVYSRIERAKADDSVQQSYLMPKLPDEFGSGTSVVHTAGKPLFEIPAKLATRFKNLGLDSLYKSNGKSALSSGEEIANNGVTLFTPLLANDSMGYLADLYNSSSAKYQSAFDALPTPLVDGLEAPKFTFEGDLHIELFDLDTGLPVTAIKKFWPKPKNQFETLRIDHPGTTDGILMIAKYPQGESESAEVTISDKYGFLVSINGRMRNNVDNEIVGECQATRAFSYSFDFHNVLDFTSDFNLVNQAAKAGYNLYDNTLSLSSKNKLEADGLMNDLIRPIFTNVAQDPMVDGRDRPLCSQQSQDIPAFYLSLKVYNIDKENGLVPMCIDSSVQWLSNETAGGGWCAANYKTVDPSKSAKVLIDRSWKPLARGWVPCEELTFCNKAADQVELRKGTDPKGTYVEYRYHYSSIKADENIGPDGKARNPLWGCEIRYLVAGVDVAGNTVYPPAPDDKQAAYKSKLATAQAAPSVIREVNPKIYFKPPPCETCECKRCKKSSGGFLGGFFKWFVFIVLIVATAGAAAAGMQLMSFIAANLAGICLIGGLGCGGDGSKQPAGNISAQGKYQACNPNVSDNCKCGQKCTKRSPPGPKWVDTLDGSIESEEALMKKLEAMSCQPVDYPIMTDGFQFTAKAAYKMTNNAVTSTSTANWAYDMESKVTHLDEVVWQEFFPDQGKFCFATLICMNGKFQVGREYDSDGHPYANTGCFNVKVARRIMFSASAPGVDTLLPEAGAAVCLEPDINRVPFNEEGEGLLSRSQLNYECGNDTKDAFANPTHYPDASRRIIGRKVEECAQGEFIDPWDPKQVQKITLAVPEAIMTWDSEGGSYFQCWKGCKPPLTMPQGPLTGDPSNDPATYPYEQKYYENYSSSYQTLPFCTMDRKQFDRYTK